MNRDKLVSAGALLGLIGVAFGAFGAHALRARISPEMLEVYKTGVSYQMTHALALLLLAALIGDSSAPRLIGRAGALMLVGTIVFSGSLYLLAITSTKAWGFVTPFGGICILAGWFALVFSSLRHSGEQR